MEKIKILFADFHLLLYVLQILGLYFYKLLLLILEYSSVVVQM
jgi:hypothetical protein